jgi:hypothetical protein
MAVGIASSAFFKGRLAPVVLLGYWGTRCGRGSSARRMFSSEIGKSASDRFGCCGMRTPEDRLQADEVSHI